jgi:hypothetical protein
LLVKVCLAQEALDVVKVLVLGGHVDHLGGGLAQDRLEEEELVDCLVDLLGYREGPEVLARPDGPRVVAAAAVKRLGRVGGCDRHGHGEVVDSAVL